MGMVPMDIHKWDIRRPRPDMDLTTIIPTQMDILTWDIMAPRGQVGGGRFVVSL